MFRGLVEAAGQSGFDRLFLEEGELAPFSRALLMALAQPSSPNSVYSAVADKHREIAEEAKALWQKWEGRGGFSLPEAIYAVGLAALLAKAKELGAEISAEDAEYALRAASFGIQRVLSPYAVWGVINALSLLGHLAPNEWAVILDKASQIETAVHEDKIRESIIKELDKLYELDQGEKSQKDWARAYLAHAYASLGEVEKACSLLDGIRDKALRSVAEALVNNNLATFGMACPGVDVCKRLGEVAGELGEMASRLDELKADKELMEYARRRSPKPEEGLMLLLEEASGLAVSGSAKCVFGKGDFEEAERLFGKAAEISKSLGNWANYLTDRGWALRAKALASLPERAEEVLAGFEKLWGEALEHWEATAPYLSTAAGILGKYLVALAFSRRYGETAELLKKHGWLLREDPIVDVATRLALRLLGAEAEPPSNKEVLEAVRGGIDPPLLPALAEVLGLPQGDDLASCVPVVKNAARCLSLIAKGVGADVMPAVAEDPRQSGIPKDCEEVLAQLGLCHAALNAVRGDAEAKSGFEQWAREELAEAGVSEELLRGTDARRLVEVLAPINSFAQFILLMRALASGDVYMARLHAERSRAAVKDRISGSLFGELADALRENYQEALRVAIAKLYYLHF